MAWAVIGGAAASALVGGLLGGSKGANSTGTQTTAVDNPRVDAALPWIQSNVGTGQQLQNWYQQNPFNAQQQTGMQNTYSDADNFRNNVMPGLLNMANNMSTQTYKRQSGGKPGSVGGYGGAVQPGGLIAGGAGPFSANANGQNFGLINWAANNPFTSTAGSK